jgi:Polysaccharide biosynthesis enzyme WcbI
MGAGVPRILVSGNCQTAGIAATLLRTTPATEVHALPLTGDTPQALQAKLEALVDKTDLWMLSPNNKVARQLAQTHGKRVQLVPLVQFGAFQPDICYAWHKGTRKLTTPHYNSAIVVWSWANGLDEAATVALFRRETYAALGYLDAWAQGVKDLRRAFSDAAIEPRFADYFLGLKRQGCFMHSINHPRIGAVVRLAGVLAEEAGLPILRDVQPGELNDGLNGTVWPVYPEIADRLGLGDGSYHWKYLTQNRFVDGVPAFVAQAFAGYQAQGIGRDEIEITYQDAAPVDRALRRVTGRPAA